MTKALITSGGGAKGAFTIGALTALKKKGFLPFDIISGTSTGSFIAALIAVDDLSTLRNQYLSVSQNDILSKQNIINNVLTGRAFLFDSHPLLNLITQHITQAVFDSIMLPTAPILCITAVSLQTGLSNVFTNKDLRLPPNRKYIVRKFSSRQMFIDALLASGSQAGFTPAVQIENEQFIDGGHRDVIPSQIVVDLNPDEVFVLSNNPSKQFVRNENFGDLLSVVLRIIGIFVQDVRENDIKILDDFLTSKGKTPIIVEPSADLDEDNPTGLRFDPPLMTNWMIEGEAVANQVLNRFFPNGPPAPLFV
jgi:predicted acylesterase/phospholipase RssA